MSYSFTVNLGECVVRALFSYWEEGRRAIEQKQKSELPPSSINSSTGLRYFPPLNASSHLSNSSTLSHSSTVAPLSSSSQLQPLQSNGVAHDNTLKTDQNHNTHSHQSTNSSANEKTTTATNNLSNSSNLQNHSTLSGSNLPNSQLKGSTGASHQNANANGHSNNDDKSAQKEHVCFIPTFNSMKLTYSTEIATAVLACGCVSDYIRGRYRGDHTPCFSFTICRRRAK